MGEHSDISWCSGTFNPWWGCARVSKACRECYAEKFAHRLGLDVWGQGADRRFFGDAHWNEPRKWNRKAEKEGSRRQIFCASMADVFEDHEGLDEQRQRLWELIAETPWLDWLLLTKRPENIKGMVPWVAAPENVWLGTTTEDQECADQRIPFLLANPAVVHFLSCEPLLGQLDLTPWLGADKVNWVLCGGESGAKAHPMHPGWAKALRDQCQSIAIPFHFKQWGEFGPAGARPGPDHHLTIDGRLFLPGERLGMNHMCRPAAMHRWGKKNAGRLLDGQIWDQMPERSHA